eukprot:3456350-Rhodomonas_salina.2
MKVVHNVSPCNLGWTARALLFAPAFMLGQVYSFTATKSFRTSHRHGCVSLRDSGLVQPRKRPSKCYAKCWAEKATGSSDGAFCLVGPDVHLPVLVPRVDFVALLVVEQRCHVLQRQALLHVSGPRADSRQRPAIQDARHLLQTTHPRLSAACMPALTPAPSRLRPSPATSLSTLVRAATQATPPQAQHAPWATRRGRGEEGYRR